MAQHPFTSHPTYRGVGCAICGRAEGYHFTADQVSKAHAVMHRAQSALGQLSKGQAADLLLDVLPWVKDSVQAKELVEDVLVEDARRKQREAKAEGNQD